MNNIWLWVAGVLMALGILIATMRKTLGNFSRKALLEKVPLEDRSRYEVFLDRLDSYEICLRFLDHAFRLGLVGSLVLAFLFPVLPEQLPESSFFKNTHAALAYLVLALAGLVLLGLELIPEVMARVSPERLLIAFFPQLDFIYWVCKIPLKAFQSL